MDLMRYDILEQLAAGDVAGDVLAFPTAVSASNLPNTSAVEVFEHSR